MGNLQIVPAEDVTGIGCRMVLSTDPEIDIGDGTRQRVIDYMMIGELSPMTEPPRAMHRVVRRFDPPASLYLPDRNSFKIAELATDIGEEEGEPLDFSLGGRERIAWLVKDTLEGTVAWFTHGGQVVVREN